MLQETGFRPMAGHVLLIPIETTIIAANNSPLELRNMLNMTASQNAESLVTHVQNVTIQYICINIHCLRWSFEFFWGQQDQIILHISIANENK